MERDNERKRGSEIFLGVIGVATLIVAIIGATFAFFSASTSSDEDAITAGSTTISLNYTDTTGTNLRSSLIPASERVATYAALNQTGTGAGANKQCTDDNANEVCSVYQFTVTNPSATTSQDITFTIDVALNGFTNLKYKIYSGEASDLTAGTTEPAVSESTVLATGIFPSVASGDNHQTVNLTGLNSHLDTTSPGNAVTFTMVIWLNETNSNQSAGASASSPESDEAGKSFAAQMVVTSGSGNGVTGVISSAGNQS